MEWPLHDVHGLLPPLSRECHTIWQGYRREGAVLFWEKVALKELFIFAP